MLFKFGSLDLLLLAKSKVSLSELKAKYKDLKNDEKPKWVSVDRKNYIRST